MANVRILLIALQLRLGLPSTSSKLEVGQLGSNHVVVTACPQNRDSPQLIALLYVDAQTCNGGAPIAVHSSMAHADATLRYIAAEHVDTPNGSLRGTMLVDASDETVGTIDGMIIDPVHRHVQYFVVRSRHWLKSHLHLVPATPARLDVEHQTVHVDIAADDLSRLREVRSDTFPAYSDDDLIAALFSAHAA